MVTSPAHEKLERTRVLSRRVIEGMIADGETIVIYSGRVLKLDTWMERHPGGKLPLLHMVGVDATSEINAIGRIDKTWTNFTPPIRGGSFRRLGEKDVEALPLVDRPPSRDDSISDAMKLEVADCLANYPSPDPITQQAITEKYEALHDRIKAEGHSALFLGCFWQQIMFTAHDAGHRAITKSFVADTLIGIFIADFCCGLSIGWWKSSHNVHHLVTNAPEHDPDIQNTPLFATCPSQFSDTRSTYYNIDFVWDGACELLIPYQKYFYYPIMAVARFNLYFLGWCHLLSPRARPLGAAAWTRPVEIFAMCGYWYVFGYQLVWKLLPDWPTRVAFVLASHIVTMLLHVQITLSHWGMPTCSLGDDESFAQKQLRTTMDIECPKWLDWLHGGLQFQAIHHLFPRVPRHNLRNLQSLVQEFCRETGIRYNIYGFLEGNDVVLSRLEDISRQLAVLGRCQKHMALTGESGLH